MHAARPGSPAHLPHRLPHVCAATPRTGRRNEGAAATVVLAPFEIELDRVMTFHGAPARLPVVLLGDSGVAALSLLHSTLDARIRSFGFEYRARSRFTPHLTLLYAEQPVEQRTVPAIGWPVREFMLIHGQKSTRRHVVLGRWPLRG